MPDLEKLKKALEDHPLAGRPPPRDPSMDPEVLRFQVEKNLAPIVTRDATVGILTEMRKTTMWARAAFAAAVLVPVALFVADRLL